MDMCESNEEFEALNEDQESNEEHMELSRRDASYAFLQAAGFSFIPGTAILSTPVIAPDEYLAQCEDAIDSCWTFANQGNYGKVERSLNLHVPTLTQYASIKSEHQQAAAELATLAMILQMILANRRLDYATRKRLGADAVRFGRVSGNPFALATALDWHGSTFTYCYRQPLRAIALFNEALKVLGGDALLNRSSLYSGLSIAYAQIKDKTNAKENERLALHYAKLARDTMPTYPELDPFYQYIRMGTAELDQFLGRAYLFLAELFPRSNYGKLAYKLFSDSLEKQAMAVGYRGQALIRKADAAIAQNEMKEFEESLRSGFDIAARNSHQGHLNMIREVLSRLPSSWQGETSIQTLQEDISQVPVVIARR
jgi:hypothetical protein